VYVLYSDEQTGHNELVRLRAGGNTGSDQESVLQLLSTEAGYHNGGDLAFGADGKLYVTVGEAHLPELAQDENELNGKILRLNPDGSIPADNPFGGDNPVYSLGHRNSFGICVDGGTDEIWETENGPGCTDEINLIAKNNYGPELKSMEIKKTKLNLNLYYEDDFIEVDSTIQNRLMKKDDKGIVLLHGLPGTGKTTYLRYLIGRLKKKVLFLSPTVAGNIMNPDFMDLLIDNPNSILIIEDAENIIMDRRIGNDSSVSNLLNISDGLLADFLSVQLVCTFNHPISMVDSALMRKGRLIAKYEFGKLSMEKAQKLSRHLGFDTVVNRPMTLAEIANQHEAEIKEKMEVIGFRRQAELMN
jgi:hypothetical protein